MKTRAQMNLSLLEHLPQLIPHALADAKDLIADEFVWHYFNPALQELEGNYVGFNGFANFFQKLGVLTDGTFAVKVCRVIPIGDELVAAHANPTMTFSGGSFESVDAAVIWRLRDNRIVEGWDIPAIYTPRSSNPREDETVHPNLLLLERLSQKIPHDLANAGDILADDFVWHFFNFRLPDVQGDYLGAKGWTTFFAKLGALTQETFQVEAVSAIPVGDELVIEHVRDRMIVEDRRLEIDAVVVWRIVKNRIVEAWDIPSMYAGIPLASLG